MPSGIEFPPETRDRFLAALAITRKVSGKDGAAERAGIAVPTLYAWRNADYDFARAWDEAKAMHDEILGEKGLAAVEAIVDDPAHPRHFDAAKYAAERSTPARADKGGDDTGIAEAIDRFTALVAGIAARDVPQLAAARTALPAGDADRPAES